jgi:hypothetical protein
LESELAEKAMIDRRRIIVARYAEWNAFSAARMAPLRSRHVLYPLIRKPNYDEILSGHLGKITRDEFERWHRTNTEAIHEASKKVSQSGLPIGWCVKLINVYLKTRVYVAGEGRPDLIRWVHPPIDNQLVAAIERHYANDAEVMKRIGEFSRIKNIDDYVAYETIIDACRIVAQKQKYQYLIEVEELWQPE